LLRDKRWLMPQNAFREIGGCPVRRPRSRSES
jgi:hypothetical protein